MNDDMNDIDTNVNISTIIDISHRAGNAIMEIYSRDFSVAYKDGNFPLTEADVASHDIISDGLGKYYPDIPILSEEGKDIPFEKRKAWSTFWLIDPIDGTKEFVKKNGEFTVNIALISDGAPVLGVVYAPVLDITYYTLNGHSYKVVKKGSPMKLPCFDGSRPYTIVASKSHFSKETGAFVEEKRQKYPNLELVSAGSSLKLCLVAEGAADDYPRLAPTMEWDTAAAHAIVKFAGKHVYEHGKDTDLVYNKQKLLNPWFIVSS